MLALSLVAMVWWTLLLHCLFDSELLGEDHVFFSGPLGGEISPPLSFEFPPPPPNSDKFHYVFWIFFTFSLSTKGISPPK